MVTSVYPKAGTGYSVAFDAPTLYNPAVGVVIDGATMTTVCGSDGKALQSGAWAQGAPVVLDRRGSKAFFKVGGAASFGLKATSGPTKPTNPEENMIWVNSTIDIGPDELAVYYGFTPPDPADLSNGDIFVLCGRGNIEAKSPDRRMGLCPTVVLQKQAGALHPRGAALWQNGAWHIFFSSVALYNYSPLNNGSLENSVDGISPTKGSLLQFSTDATAGSVPTGMAASSSWLIYLEANYVHQCKGKSILIAVRPTTQNSTSKCIVGCGLSTNNQGLLVNIVEDKVRANYWNGASVQSESTLALDAWNVIALVQDPSSDTAQLFINGVPDNTVTGVNLAVGSTKLSIANRPVGYTTDYAFIGKFSEFFWYSRALSKDEVCGLSLSILNKVKGVLR